MGAVRFPACRPDIQTLGGLLGGIISGLSARRGLCMSSCYVILVRLSSVGSCACARALSPRQYSGACTVCWRGAGGGGVGLGDALVEVCVVQVQATCTAW